MSCCTSRVSVYKSSLGITLGNLATFATLLTNSLLLLHCEAVMGWRDLQFSTDNYLVLGERGGLTHPSQLQEVSQEERDVRT